MPMDYDDTLRSHEFTEPARLLIKNLTQRPVDILWINYEAKLIRYRLLRAGEDVQINTFKTHPWIFRDYLTGLLMHTNHKEVLWPEAATEKRPIQRVYIHFPLQSLKTIALWATISRVRNHNEISRMEIPQTLRTDLETLFRQFHDHHVQIEQLRLRRRQQQQQQQQHPQQRNE